MTCIKNWYNISLDLRLCLEQYQSFIYLQHPTHYGILQFMEIFFFIVPYKFILKYIFVKLQDLEK